MSALVCSECHLERDKELFSQAQLRKGHDRRCRNCVEAKTAAAKPAAHGETHPPAVATIAAAHSDDAKAATPATNPVDTQPPRDKPAPASAAAADTHAKQHVPTAPVAAHVTPAPQSTASVQPEAKKESRDVVAEASQRLQSMKEKQHADRIVDASQRDAQVAPAASAPLQSSGSHKQIAAAAPNNAMVRDGTANATASAEAPLVTIDGLYGKRGWFTEIGSDDLWPGQALCLQYERVLHHQRSPYQDILVLQSSTYGKVLVLDGVVQVTERDQFSYAEMISHLPMFAHPNPKRVLLIGGGDGATLTELLKHKSVKRVTICEIDRRVIDVCTQHYPQYAPVWSHPKLRLCVEDGAEFLKRHRKEFDVIIVDSSDPIGPSEALFQRKFYKTCKRALRKGGVLCAQGECMWLHTEIIADICSYTSALFDSVRYGYTTIPTYGGEIGFLLCSKGANKLHRPKRSVKKALGRRNAASLRYYSNNVHRAAFVLPQFVRDEIDVFLK